jgi:hypothetical protein
MKIQIRTKDDLVKLLNDGISYAWRINKSRLDNVTNVEIYNFSGNSKIVGTFDLERTKVLENGRVAVAFTKAKIETCEFKWVGQYPIKYKSSKNEEVALLDDEKKDENKIDSYTHPIDKIAESLKNNFLFQASLGSKELFHSNMLAWILEQQNKDGEFQALKMFIKEITGNDVGEIYGGEFPNFRIEREAMKIDLTIKWQQDDKWNAVFIENKMKSIPTLKQLEDYNEKINIFKGDTKLYIDDKNKINLTRVARGKFLLTPYKSEIEEEAREVSWKNITYSEEILDFFNKLLNEEILFANADIKNIICKYIDFIKAQNKLLEEFKLGNSISEFPERSYDFYTSVVKNKLANLKLNDLVLKLSHQKISTLIRDKLLQSYSHLIVYDWRDLVAKEKSILVANGFTRTSGISDIKIHISKGISLALQLQENSLRYAVEVHDKKKKMLDNNVDYALNLVKSSSKLWFYDTKGELLLGKGRNKENLKIDNSNIVFNSYGLNFIYLNKDVSSYCDKPISEIVDFICSEVKRVLDNYDEFKTLIP